MRFLKGLWKVLVGVKDALALLLLLIVFVGIFAATRGGQPAGIPSKAALVIELDGTLVDQATERSPFQLATAAGDIVPETQTRDVVEALKRAAKDDRIDSVVLDLETFLGAGASNLREVSAAIGTVKAAKKPVYAYGAAYSDDGYFLAAQANEAWLNPLGAVLLTGPGGSGLYFKDALEKLGIDIRVFRVGTYKSAVEPFTRSESSPEAKAANQALVDTLWDSYVADIRKARAKVDLDRFIADLPARIRGEGGDFARLALTDGLVDKVGTRTQFGQMMVKRVGKGDEDRPGAFAQVDLKRYLAASTPTRPTSGAGVGVVYVAGEIVDGQAPKGTAGGETIATLIEQAMTDDDIKALVVRVDSPGGSVTASEQIRQALADAKAEGIPVVASFGPVAASGGYWVSTAADEVFAEPTTITGSIGVFAIIPTFEKTLAKLGIGADGVKSTPYSGEPNVLQGLSPETGVLLQASVEDIYRRFTTLVGTARKIPVKRVDEIGQGRVWDGGSARQFGLVTAFGGLDEAVAAAAKRAGLDAGNVRVIDIEKKPGFPLALLESMFAPEESAPTPSGDAIARAANLAQLRAAAAVAEAVRLAGTPSVQTRCVTCAAYASPRLSTVDAATLAKLTAAAR